MQRLFPILLAACLSVSAQAQSIKAQDLEKLCQSTTETERLTCAFIVKAYMDGFLEGVAKGVLDTYKYDEQLFGLIKDNKMSDMAPRVGKVIELSTCVQRVAVKDMVDTFVDYVRTNPNLRQDSYRKAMTRAIVSKYCGK